MGLVRQYFGTDGIRGCVGDEPITPEFILKLGWAIGVVLGNSTEDGENKVLIGKDTRISGYLFESALEAGLSAAGVNVHLLGPLPTPAIAYLTRHLNARAGIVVSASHNLYQDNGIKLFSSKGFKLSDELELAIEQQLNRPLQMVKSEKLGKAKRLNDAVGRYSEFCKKMVAPYGDFRGYKIVVDCANGATYRLAPRLLEELGATVIPLAVDPNGLNINQECGSTKPNQLQQAVVDANADLGIAFDGDGDRVIMVERGGEIVDGDELLFIIAKDTFVQGRMTPGIVGTQMSNLGLELAMGDLGIHFVRVPVGDRYVLSELQRRNWHLGGESSGHLINLGLTTTGDGMLSALQILAIMQRTEMTLTELRSGMQKFPQIMINVRLNNSSDPLQKPHVQAAIKEAEALLGERGRILLRMSGTEPLIRVMVEGEELTIVKNIANELAAVVEQAVQ